MFMADLGNHNEFIHDAALEQADFRVPEATLHPDKKIVGKLRNSVARALLVAAPMIASCGGQVDTVDSFQGVGGAQAGQTTENMNLRDHEVVVDCNQGGTWRFQGNYPEDFSVVVSVDGKEIATKEVVVDHSIDPSTLKQFSVEGPVGNVQAKNVQVQTFDLDGNVIPIESDPQTKGMYGNPDCPVGLE